MELGTPEKTSVPEMNVQIEGLDSFVFTQLLQKGQQPQPDH